MRPFNSAASLNWCRSTRCADAVQDLIRGAHADIGGDQREFQLVQQIGIDFALAVQGVFERGNQAGARLFHPALELFKKRRLLLHRAE